ncbi:MAG: radical SAM protein, partial [Patescibacteria group bacterium]
MNKIILINPPFNIPKENYDSSVSVGLLSIASYLSGLGIEVEIIDGARQSNYREILKEKSSQVEWFGLSVMTTQISEALEISALIKKENPRAKIVWGGSHPTFFPSQTIKNESVDIVCVGEGEKTMEEIIRGNSLDSIKGIVYKENNEIKENPPRELHDPSEMPSFNWDLVPREILEKLYLIPSLTSRGCPHRCTFCINAILCNRWRPRTAEQVLTDLKTIKEKEYFKNKKIRFWDENFFVDITRAKKIVSGMIENNLGIPWETTVRADYLRPGMVDEDFLFQLKKSGCYLLSFGAESGSPRILEKIKKEGHCPFCRENLD